MILSTYFTGTALNEIFSWKLYLPFNFMILGWFWNFLIIAVSWSFNKSVFFGGYSKMFNISTVFAKSLLKVLAISSFFTSKISFLITSFELLVIFSFSIGIILESPWACSLEKYGLHSFQKGFKFFWYLYVIEITKF